MQKSNPELTICSVYHNETTKRILEINADLIQRLNPGVSSVQIAANNSPGESIHINHPLVREIAGIPIPTFVPKGSFVGYHEGGAMNRTLPEIKTRFGLLLDHDFFIVRPNWISDVIAYMKENDIAILAAPYHPKYWVKFRYFPGAYCIFFDREKFGDEFLSWDFMPQRSKEELSQEEAARERKMAARPKNPTPPSFFRSLLENIKKRRYIGSGKDVSYDLYRRYAKNPAIKVESLPATASLKDFLVHYRLSSRWYPLLYAIEQLIPERWSFVPHRKGYFTFTHFKDLGAFDIWGKGMEEWWWQEKPFGFHVRGFKERHLQEFGGVFNPEDNITIIRSAIESFTKFSKLP